MMSSMCAEPQTLMEALVLQGDKFSNLTLYTMFPVSLCPYANKEMKGHIRVKTFSVGKLTEAIRRGQAEYVPIHISQVGSFIKKRKIPVDIAMVQVSAPDMHGNCNLGISVDYIKEAIEAAKVVIAEVNEKMPRTKGDSCLPVEQIDYFIDVSRDLLTYDTGRIGEVEDRIGELTSELIPDGAVLQYGPGKVQRAILRKLENKKELGIHSGLVSDDIIPLVERGVITGSKKEINYKKIVAAAVIGTRKIYDFVHENDLVEIKMSSYTHDIKTLSKLKKFVSLNSAIEVDLLGQVNSEAVGLNVINGVGGTMDFVRGAISSEEGRAILALPSTAKRHNKSRIVPIITGSVVTAGWADFNFIVTEYGVADLSGLTVRERVKKMISIAHPQFREELRETAVKMSLL